MCMCMYYHWLVVTSSLLRESVCSSLSFFYERVYTVTCICYEKVCVFTCFYSSSVNGSIYTQPFLRQTSKCTLSTQTTTYTHSYSEHKQCMLTINHLEAGKCTKARFWNTKNTRNDNTTTFLLLWGNQFCLAALQTHETFWEMYLNAFESAMTGYNWDLCHEWIYLFVLMSSFTDSQRHIHRHTFIEYILNNWSNPV